MRYSLREPLSDTELKSLAAYPDLMKSLLFHRGIATRDEAEAFLNPDYATLHDPFLMKDMEKAVERILRAIAHKERIVVYSDYDADGIPGAVVMHDFFKKIGFENFYNYIPHRHNEGFGLNHDAIEKFIADKVNVLITIDCGIADLSEVGAAAQAGIDVIVTDHHLPLSSGLPPAYAILNSKQSDCAYPYRMLCGAAVAWKLVSALTQRGREQKVFSWKEGQEKWLLDMVGLATLSDMVPLQNENRTLAYYGMKVLKKTPRLGLRRLLSKLNILPHNLTEDDLGFMVTPRINAASRMGVPMDAFLLLSAEDESEADRLADHLEHINNERKGIVASMVKEMKKHVEERGVKDVIVMGNPDWKPSLLGLAANSLSETYNRPVFLWGRESGDGIKGSCRSQSEVSVVALMEVAKEHFEDFGGHHASGGFSVAQDKIHFIEDALIEARKTLEAGPHVDKVMSVDSRLSIDEVGPDTWRIIEKLAPFGEGNPKPLFLFEQVTPHKVKQFGKTGDHLELTFKKEWGGEVKAIGFFMTPDSFETVPKEGVALNLIATMEKSMFRNRPEIRLRITDII